MIGGFTVVVCGYLVGSRVFGLQHISAFIIGREVLFHLY